MPSTASPMTTGRHPKPRGKAPESCHWDFEAGVWRHNDTDIIYDAKAAERARSAAHRRTETTRAGRREGRRENVASRENLARLVQEAQAALHVHADPTWADILSCDSRLHGDCDSDQCSEGGNADEDYSHDIGRDTRTVRRLLEKNKTFRRCTPMAAARERRVVAGLCGRWRALAAHCTARRARRRRRGLQRDHHAENRSRLLPCETAAIESSRSRSTLRNAL